MGGLQVCSPQPNGVIAEDGTFMSSTSSSSPSLPLSNPDPSSFDAECWAKAEQTTQEIVWRIQPTIVADQKRKKVIDYIQRLIRCCLGYEVFPYGSVPLKTYLPDGDIDLTALSSPSADDALASDICAVLEDEEQNEAAEYKVKNVQFIDAEVKLVKCLVQNIIVDISFNQLGGLCTLCFLEQVDLLIGKDHLFKRSIILIKAWCYYESRILGAHHGLISTYALETLVLYIFHQFHSSLNGPLAVLYKFLDYFSKFDWENCCVSLNGPVSKSSLPDIIAEVPKKDGNDLLLSGESLKKFVNMFTVPSRGLETNSRAFSQKYLNIIDPLKENNNLGRSVHRGNFHRIRSAFKFGACKLRQILLLPRENIADEVNKFFKNTLERHGSKCRGHAQDHVLTVGARGSWPSSSLSCAKRGKMCSEDRPRLLLGLSDNKISGMEDKNTFRIRNNSESSSVEVVLPEEVSESDCPADGNAFSGYHLSGNAKEPTTSGFLGCRTTNDMSDCSPLSSNLGTSLLWNSQYTPHFNFVDLVTENRKTENGQLCKEMPANSVIDREACSVLQLDLKENHLVARNSVCLCSNHEGMISNFSAFSSPEVLNSLLDLSGDYHSHIWSLLYSQCCRGYSSATVSPSPLPPSQSRKNRLDAIHPSLQFKRNFHSQMNTNGAISRPPFYPLNQPTLARTTILSEKRQNPRGIGTYFPKTNYRRDRDRSWPCREWNQASGTNGHLERHNNGFAPPSPETNSFEEGNRELSQAHYPVVGRGKSGSVDFHRSHPPMQGSSLACGFSLPCNRPEFGSIGHLPLEVPSSEVSSHLDSGTPCTLGSTSSLLPLAVQDPRQIAGNRPERVIRHLYHLEDEHDFPPLSL